MVQDHLNADLASVVDLINVKTLPETISDYLHDCGIKKFNNLRKFYSSMLDFFGEDIKNSYLNRILKYLSSDKASDIYLLDGINDGVYDNELRDFCKCLVKTINATDNYLNLYESLNRKINYSFYESEVEYCKIKTYNNDKDYENFIFYLLKHAFKKYKISLPGIMGRSLYMQSQTMNARRIPRIRFLNAASMLGNDDATVSLYCSLFPEDYNVATEILMRAKESELVLWSIAFNLENNFLDKHLIQLIKSKYKYIFDEVDDFINDITVSNKGRIERYDVTLFMAYQIYNYCYKKYQFTKAGNSLGKLLLFDMVSYKHSRVESVKMAKIFLNREIANGNINAITNMAVYLYENQDDKDYNYEDNKRFFITSASFGDQEGNYYLGKILFDEGHYDQAYKYIKYAADVYFDSKCFALLGKYYEIKEKYDDAISYYKRSLASGYYDVAYDLALLYFNLEKFNKSKDGIYNGLGLNVLETNYNLLSESIKKKADLFLNKKF